LSCDQINCNVEYYVATRLRKYRIIQYVAINDDSLIDGKDIVN